jgi:hypothetical protein
MWESNHGGPISDPVYMQTLDSIAAYCASHGLWVIWDFHEDRYPNVNSYMGCDQSNYDSLFVSAINNATYMNQKKTQLQWFAKHFENYTSVIGIEIWNEPPCPYGWDAYSRSDRQAYMTQWSNFAQNLAHAIHTTDTICQHYLVFVDSIQSGTTNVDWTYNGNKLLTEPNVVYTYHYYNWHFGATDQFVIDYANGNYAQGRTDMISRYQQRFWDLRDNYNVPLWYGEFGFWDSDVGGGTDLQQLIKDNLQIHNEEGISWGFWGCHTSLGETIIKQYTYTHSPSEIFNWKGLLMANYTTR